MKNCNGDANQLKSYMPNIINHYKVIFIEAKSWFVVKKCLLEAFRIVIEDSNCNKDSRCQEEGIMNAARSP